METTGEFNLSLKELQCQLRWQKATVEELGPVLDKCAKGVLRHDQAVSLDDLKVKIMTEADDARMMETVASNEFNKRKLTRGITGFAAGALFAAMAGQSNPLSKGVSILQSALDQKAPFDTVLVAIGKQGLPEDVTVVPLSSLARGSNRSESQIREALQKRGYLVMALQTFAMLIENLKPKVLDGSISLPLSIEKIANKLPGIIRNPRPML